MPVYDVNGVTESDGEVFKLHERGVYPAEIISSEWKDVEKPDSDYLGATYLDLGIKVTNPDTELAVTVKEIIMLPFPDAMDAEQIRKSVAKLKLLQIVTGTEDMGDQIDNDRFLHTQFRAEVVKSGKETDQYGIQNKIKDYLPL